MKKKGFTLIELLAVIVILAIIALIATPLVLKYIETARTNSKITSTQNYMKAVENALASYSITHKGQSYSEGCYEISTLNTDLDISMKGNMPSEGKVCIEDNKIKKSMVKYPDNKVIKYEDNKSTISDEETYESFNSVSNYIIDVDVEFAYDESQGIYVGTLPITKEIAEQFEKEMDYDLIIDEDNIEVFSSFNNPRIGFALSNYMTSFSNHKAAIFTDESIRFMTYDKITGLHNVKIGNPRPIKERTFFSILTDGYMFISSYNFIGGNAHIVIKDDEGVEYYNNTIGLMENHGDGFFGADSGCRGNIPDFPDVYTALTNGKTITIEVTQEVEGKEVFSSVSKDLNSMIYFDGYHHSSNNFLAIDVGC